LPKFATFLVSPFQYIEWLQVTAKIISSVLEGFQKIFPVQLNPVSSILSRPPPLCPSPISTSPSKLGASTNKSKYGVYLPIWNELWSFCFRFWVMVKKLWENAISKRKRVKQLLYLSSYDLQVGCLGNIYLAWPVWPCVVYPALWNPCWWNRPPAGY